MEKIEYARLYEREKFYWWNIGRRKILEAALSRFVPAKDNTILDLGCGAGGNFLFLKNFGRVTGLDLSEEALRFSQDKGFAALVSGNAESLQFANGSFSIVASLDVIEHVDNDMKALREIYRVLKDNGTLLLTVPAHLWLWSRHDEALHHRRRYEEQELEKKLKDAGFRVLTMTHFVMPSIPFIALKKAIRRGKRLFGMHEKIETHDVELPNFLNSMLILWLSFELQLMRFVKLPWGSSLLVVARK